MKKKNLIFGSIIILLIFIACHSSKQSDGSTADIISGSETLFQFTWNLTELQDLPVTAKTYQVPFLLFTQGQPNRVSGNTSCNNLTGSFILSKQNTIKFSPLATTRMACADNTIEIPFLEAISKVDKWTIIDDKLLLSSGNKVVAKFKAKVF